MIRKFVITDIHGCAETFRYLVEKQLKMTPSDILYLLGDYIDRGPDSKGVLDYIFELANSGHQVKCLRGNHEQFLLDARRGPEDHQFWLENGGHEALESFHAITVFDIPAKYIDFLDSLTYYIELEDFFLVHAGFNFSSSNPFLDKDAMMGIRNMNINRSITKSKKIIHGHTPTRLSEIKKKISDPNNDDICLDSGCFFNNYPELGNLVALELNSWELYIAPRQDVVD